MEANPCAHEWGIRLTQDCVDHDASLPNQDSPVVAVDAILPLPSAQAVEALAVQGVGVLPKGWYRIDSVRGPLVFWNSKFQQ